MRNTQIRTLFAIVLFFGLLAPIDANAASLECPNTWQEKLPEMNIKTFKGKINGIPYVLFDNNLEGEGNLEKAAPLLMNKIKSYGPNIITKIRFEVSESDSFAKVRKTTGLNIGFGEIDYLRNGIFNGDYIRLSIYLEVKDCSPVVLNSNSRQITGIGETLTNVDTYVELIRNAEDKNRLLNFKEKALIQPLLKTVSESLVRAAKIGASVPVERIRSDELGFYFGWEVMPISSGSCLTPGEWGSTRSVVFNSFPCRFGLYGFYTAPLTEWIGPFAYRKSPGSGERFFEYTFPVLVGIFEANGYSLSNVSEAESSTLKKLTITCIKGKLTKKVTAVRPKCPSGYNLKK